MGKKPHTAAIEGRDNRVPFGEEASHSAAIEGRDNRVPFGEEASHCSNRGQRQLDDLLELQDNDSNLVRITLCC